MITDSSIEKFLDDLAGGNPTPGGGSAAAIMGAMGAALVSMVCNVTIGKKGYEAVEPEMKAVRDESERVRRRLTAMVAEDIAAFDSIMAAYKLPKATDGEKALRGALEKNPGSKRNRTTSYLTVRVSCWGMSRFS